MDRSLEQGDSMGKEKKTESKNIKWGTADLGNKSQLVDLKNDLEHMQKFLTSQHKELKKMLDKMSKYDLGKK